MLLLLREILVAKIPFTWTPTNKSISGEGQDHSWILPLGRAPAAPSQTPLLSLSRDRVG